MSEKRTVELVVSLDSGVTNGVVVVEGVPSDVSDLSVASDLFLELVSGLDDASVLTVNGMNNEDFVVALLAAYYKIGR